MSTDDQAKTELLALLEALQNSGDTEAAHIDADEALLKFIADPEVTEAYEQIDKWYA